MKKILLLCTALLLLHVSYAQQNSLDSFNVKREQMKKTGMLVLGGWALTNIAVGAIASANTSGTTKYFHQMNMYWNFFNLGLATAGYLGIKHALGLSLTHTLTEQHSIEKIFLVNGALDVAYITAGLYLKERSKNTLKNPERLKGYGQSIILQGGFLLLFDGVNYDLHQHHGKQLYKALEKVQLAGTDNGIGVVVKL